MGALVVTAGRRAVVGKVRGAGAIEEAAGGFDWDGSSGHIGLDLQIRGSPWFEEIKGGVADGWLRFCDDGDVLQVGPPNGVGHFVGEIRIRTPNHFPTRDVHVPRFVREHLARMPLGSFVGGHIGHI